MLPRPVVSVENLSRGREAGGPAQGQKEAAGRGAHFITQSNDGAEAGQGLAAAGFLLPVIGPLPLVLLP